MMRMRKETREIMATEKMCDILDGEDFFILVLEFKVEQEDEGSWFLFLFFMITPKKTKKEQGKSRVSCIF
jgi:hypothetical protein